MLDVASDLRSCLLDAVGEKFVVDGAEFDGYLRSEHQVSAVGDHTVGVNVNSIIAVAGDVPSSLVKKSLVTRKETGESWVVKDLEPDKEAGAIIIVLRR